MIEFKFFNEEWNEDKATGEARGSDTNISRVAGIVEDANTD